MDEDELAGYAKLIESLPPDMSAEVHAISITTGDPQNDQIAAQVREELEWFIDSVKLVLRQGPEVEAMTAIALLILREEEAFPRDRLTSLLAGALVALAKQRIEQEGVLS